MARDPSALDPTSLLAHRDFVTALARGLVADRSRADDVVQDTWLAALTNPPRDASRMRAWLAAVTRNFARQSSRRDDRARGREHVAARAEGIPSTAELCEREATRRGVVEALLELSEPQRSALLLRFYEGLPPREIARRLGVPVETARTRIKRGLAELRVRLDERHGGSRDAWSLALVDWLDLARAPVSSAVFAIPIVAAACLALVVWIRVRPAAEPETRPLVVRANSPAAASPQAPRDEPRESTRVAAAAASQAPASAPAKPATASPSPHLVQAQIRVRERTITGRVMNVSDAPIAGALVYVGNQIRARGDEPFKPFKAERITDGVLTDAAGQFTLTGSGRWITAWHADYGARTVAWKDADSIVLQAKATLRGRVVDAQGLPAARRRLTLDRDREGITSDEGSFEFADVELGAHGIQIADAALPSDANAPSERRPRGKAPWYVVRFDAPASDSFTLALDPAPIHVRLTSSGAPFTEALEWIPVGTGRVSSMPAKEVKASRVVEITGIVPSSYVLLAKTGQQAGFEFERAPSSPAIDLGTASLLVRAPAKTRVYVVPAGSDEFVQLMAGRVASQTVSDSGKIRIAPLRAGRYDIGIDREGVVATVTVEANGAEVVLE